MGGREDHPLHEDWPSPVMAPLKRKSSVAEDAAPKKAVAESRPAKKRRSDDTSPNAAAPARSPPSRSPHKASVLREEDAPFPRGGASVLTPLEHKQIRIEATNDVLFEQSASKKSSKPVEEDGEERDTVDPTPPRRKPKLRSKAKKTSALVQAEENSVRIEGLSYRVSRPSHDVAVALMFSSVSCLGPSSSVR